MNGAGVIDSRAILMDLGAGTVRPMRRAAPLFPGTPKAWDGFSLEEHRLAESESKHVCLLNTVVFLVPDGTATLEWHGEGRSVCKNIGRGQISILPADHPYSARLRVEGRSLIVSLEQKLLASASAELGVIGDVEPEWAHGVDDPFVRELVMILRSEAGSTEKAGVAYAQSLASALAMHIVRRYSRRCDVGVNPGKGLAPRALRRALQFIHDHLDEDLTIQQLAETTEMSACHFARMFRLSTGIPPHKYVVRRRVTRAKHLLLNKGVSLATAALEAGFCDQGHMTRCFRQVLGTTPAVFVRSIRGVSERDKG